MKYLILLYDAQGIRERMTPELIAEMQAVMGELTESGELVRTEGLAEPAATKTIRFADAAPVVTDGPYAEVKEQMGGFLLVEIESGERAVEIASRWPGVLVDAIEVRPLLG